MNPEEQEYFSIDEKNRVVLRVIEDKELELTERGRQLGEAIERNIESGKTETIFLELYVKELALIQHTLSAFGRVKELDVEGYDIVGHLESYLKLNKATDQVKHLGKYSLNIWSVGVAYENFIYEKHLLDTYTQILNEFNKI